MRTVLRLLVVGAAILTAGKCVAQAQVGVNAPHSKGGIALSIKPRQGTVKAGAPVWVELSETNNLDHAIGLPAGSPEDIYYFTVRDGQDKEVSLAAGSKAYTRDRPGQERRWGGQFGEVRAGTTDSGAIEVSKYFDLSRPGVYTIQLELVWIGPAPAWPLKTNTIKVTVVP